jgi:hypothetical protein
VVVIWPLQLLNFKNFPPDALASDPATAQPARAPFSGSILAEKPEAKLLNIRYPPIEAKIIANITKLALEKRELLKLSVL